MASRLGGFGRFQEPLKRVARMDPLRPYQDPTQVPLGEKPKTYRV